MPTQYTTVLRLRMLPEDYANVKNKAEAYRQPLSPSPGMRYAAFPWSATWMRMPWRCCSGWAGCC